MYFFLAFTLTGCSSGVPTESDAEDVFATLFHKQIESGDLKIDSFDKINGQESEIFGVNEYTIEYKATISFPKGIAPECLNDVNPDGRPKGSWNCLGKIPRKPGATEERTGKFRFQKTEKGWENSQNHKLY